MAAALAALAGALLGVLALAMAGPYLRHQTHRALWTWLALAAGAVTGEHWSAAAPPVADISVGAVGLLAVVAAAAACAVALLVWRMLPRFPAGVARSESARGSTTLTAVAFGNLPLLTWIAEDTHWRGRRLASRRWPPLPPALVLAWADWRRLSRRPAVLAILAASTLAPALAAAAITGHARGDITAATMLAGALAAGTQGTAATRRDTHDPTLRRLLGVDARTVLAVRAVLLSAAWLTLALVLLVSAGVLRGWLWPLLGPLAGPGLAAAALRIARTGSIDPADSGPDTPLGPTPSWLITRELSLLLAAAGGYPALRAVLAGQIHAATFSAQAAVSGVVLAGYLTLTRVSP